jgi:molybdate/tungstate transport system substrate-binding protein
LLLAAIGGGGEALGEVPGAPAEARPGVADAGKPASEGELTVFHAGSLAMPMKQLVQRYEKRYPGTRVLCESSGSRTAARKLSELGRNADVLVSADYQTIQELLMPVHAEWFVCFARNEMVLAYTERSKFASEITTANWFEILARPEVSFGHSDPNKDPAGYRTLLVWKLADLYYRKKLDGRSIEETLSKACPVENIRPGSVELLPLLQSMALDYAFEYRSVAEQHRLRYVRFPDELNLANPRLAEHYGKVSVELAGQRPSDPPIVQKGAPIVYAFTIPSGAPNKLAARRFADLLIGPEGEEVLNADHQTVIPGGRIGFLPTSVPLDPCDRP